MRVFTMLFVVVMLSLVVSPTLYAKKPIGRDSVWSTFGTDIYYNDGNVGIGTDSPGMDLEVHPTIGGGGINIKSSAENVAPGLTLTAGVNVAQIGISSGLGSWSSYNSQQQGDLVIDNNSTTASLVFGTNNTGRMFIDNAGNVGIGTANPVSELDVNGEVVIWNNASASAFELSFFGTDGTDIRSQSQMLIRPTGYMLLMPGDTQSVMLTTDGKVGIGEMNPSYKLHVNGTAAGTSWTNLSSREYKENIKKVDSAKHDEMLSKLMKVDLNTYNYKKEYGDDHSTKLGFIAEEMPKEVLSKDGKAVDVYELLTYTIGAMKAQQGMIKELQEKNRELEAKISSL